MYLTLFFVTRIQNRQLTALALFKAVEEFLYPICSESSFEYNHICQCTLSQGDFTPVCGHCCCFLQRRISNILHLLLLFPTRKNKQHSQSVAAVSYITECSTITAMMWGRGQQPTTKISRRNESILFDR